MLVETFLKRTLTGVLFLSSLEIERAFAYLKQDGVVAHRFAAMVNISRVMVEEEHRITAPTDEELVAATIAGEEAAFAELFRRHKRMTSRIAGRFFPRHEQIEDILQAAFCQAYLALKQFQGKQENSFPAWLSRITANACLDELRRQQRRQEELFSNINEVDAAQLETQLRTTVASTEQRIISRDLANKLLAHLKPEDRLMLTLLYEEGWSTAEIGKLLGWSIANVKVRAFNARLKLQRVLEQL